MKKNIALIYGGYSSEEIVSQKSLEGFSFVLLPWLEHFGSNKCGTINKRPS
jgi:hypothetical protein